MWTGMNSDGLAARDNVNCQDAPSQNRTRFPTGTVTRIYRHGRSPLTAGQADTKCWRLVFRGHGKRFIEPLMGWTGSTDPLSGLELKFPTLQSAIRYARRQALEFTVEGALPPGDAP